MGSSAVSVSVSDFAFLQIPSYRGDIGVAVLLRISRETVSFCVRESLLPSVSVRTLVMSLIFA